MPLLRLMSRLLIVLSLTGCAHASSLDDFRSSPDNRTAVRASLGVRSARPISPRQVEVVVGMSVSRAAGNAEAWRIISYDDANYAYEKFVKPSSAQVRTELETAGVAGSAFPKYERTIVTLALPQPMRSSSEYYVMGQGVNGEMVTGARTAAGFVYQAGQSPAAETNPIDLAVLGLRKVEPVGPGLIRLEFGPNFSTQSAADPASYRIKINGQAVGVTNVGRRTMVDTYLPVGWPFQAFAFHDIYLQLERPLRTGETLGVEVAESVTHAPSSVQLTFDEKRSLTNSIKVNQVGYLTDSPVKIAYLGRWMGSFPEQKTAGISPALTFADAPAFQVCGEETGEVVYTGKSSLIHRTGEKNEGFHKVDHSGENVYLLDFTQLKKPGRYYITVPGVGRSLPFEVGDDVYAKAFAVQAHGVFVQRCGIELAPPYSDWRRIACHKNGLVPVTQVHGEGHEIKSLKDKAQQGAPKINAFGGHHDAGDYNPRSHIDVAQTLMDAYEIAPRKFFDGQLNIPEKANGIPDILDEAHWALRLWINLQDQDGGVHNGTESAGDPNFIQTVELDPVGDYAYPKDAAGSFTFAGAMAQASRLWRQAGQLQMADDFLERAVRAYRWANANPPAKTDDRRYNRQFTDPKAYAAAQLLKTTGEVSYNKDFLEVAVWSRKRDSEIDAYQVFDQSLAALTYATTDPAIVDKEIQAAARKAIIQRADWFIVNAKTMAYAFIRHPNAPINWGTGAYENYLPAVIWAWHLTGDEQYHYWMVRTCDNTLGANPMNISWIKDLGTRTVRAPLHNSRYSHLGEVVAGQQAEGPVQSGEGYRVTEVAYPPIRNDFAILHTYVDTHFAIAMNEGVIPAQAKSMATFGLLLPDRK